MPHPILSLQRLERIFRVLNQNAGTLRVREFGRSFSIKKWELERAAALGCIKIETCNPSTGRPSRVVRTVSNPEPAKLPPYRRQIERRISIRHWRFAFISTMGAIKGGSSWAGGLPCFTDAYLKAFPEARKRRAASASMSRLLRYPSVKAARAWFYSQLNGEIPKGERMPETVRAIWQRLSEAGSWRAQ